MSNGSSGQQGSTRPAARWRVAALIASISAWPHLARLVTALALGVLVLVLIGLQPWLASRRQAGARAQSRSARQPSPPPPGSPAARVVTSYRTALDALAAADLGPAANETISEHARRLPPRLEPARELAALALIALYGPTPLSREDAQRARQLRHSLIERLRTRPSPPR